MIEKLKQINFTRSPTFDNTKVGVALTAFNRPDLFSQVISSMNRCEELEQIPIFLYADGGSSSKQNEIIEEFKKLKFKNKFLIKRGSNFGCEKNTINCLDDLLKHLSFDFCFLIEDDIKLGKNYFKICYESFKKIKAEIDPKIGIFQGHSMCFMDVNQKKENLNKFEHIEGYHHWGVLISKESYATVRQILSKYYDLINSFANGNNANSAMLFNKVSINNIFDDIIKTSGKQLSDYIMNTYHNKQNVHCTLGWDGAFELGLACSDYKRYKSTVNLNLNIGEHGTHFSTAAFKSMGLDKMTLDEVWL